MKGLLIIAAVVILLILLIAVWYVWSTPTPAPAYTPPTPVNKPVVDCVMGEWSTCDKTCGGGTQTRSILTQPQNGGEACGSLSQPCNTQPCPPPPPPPVYVPPTTRVQMCCPFEEIDCPRAGAQMTCQEFWDCYKKTGHCPCGGEAWYNKCGYAGDPKGVNI